MQKCGAAIFELLESIIYKPSSTLLHHYKAAKRVAYHCLSAARGPADAER